MSSQLDLDQGGTIRQTERIYLGPSVGWQYVPSQAVLAITAAGVYTLERGMNLVTINANGNVTVNLPSSKASAAGPQAIPGQWIILPVVVVDIGGFAGANTYSIVPFGAETISSLPSVPLTTPFGAFILKPILETGGWTLQQ